jgi:hypothetical protein
MSLSTLPRMGNSQSRRADLLRKQGKIISESSKKYIDGIDAEKELSNVKDSIFILISNMGDILRSRSFTSHSSGEGGVSAQGPVPSVNLKMESDKSHMNSEEVILKEIRTIIRSMLISDEHRSESEKILQETSDKIYEISKKGINIGPLRKEFNDVRSKFNAVPGTDVRSLLGESFDKILADVEEEQGSESPLFKELYPLCNDVRKFSSRRQEAILNVQRVKYETLIDYISEETDKLPSDEAKDVMKDLVPTPKPAETMTFNNKDTNVGTQGNNTGNSYGYVRN